jgi:hypothetical protein
MAHSPPNPSLESRLEALTDLSKEELRSGWSAIYGVTPPKRLGRDLLMRAVAYDIQGKALGGLKAGTRRKLLRLADGKPNSADRTPQAAASLKPGTRLVRSWQGRTYEVTVLEEGFAWRGHSYRSLSRIARDITGTRWSGPAFFGLTNKGSQAGDRP